MKRIAHIIAGLLLSASAGAVIHAPATLQNAYDSSATPKITTNAAAGSVKIQRGSAADTDAAFEVLNGSGVSAASVLGNGTLSLGGKLMISTVAPVIASGFGTNPSIVASSTAAFRVQVGTGGTATTGVLTMPAAATGWVCHANNETTNSTTVFITKETADTATSVTLTSYSSAGTVSAWTAGDLLHIMCMPY